MDHATIAAEILQGAFTESGSTDVRRRLMELPEVEPHHICITGGQAEHVAKRWLKAKQAL